MKAHWSLVNSRKWAAICLENSPNRPRTCALVERVELHSDASKLRGSSPLRVLWLKFPERTDAS